MSNDGVTATQAPANPITATITLEGETAPVQITVGGDTNPDLSPAELKTLFEKTREILQTRGPGVPPLAKLLIQANTPAGVTPYEPDNVVLFSSLNQAFHQPSQAFADLYIDHAARVFSSGNTTITATVTFQDGKTGKISWEDTTEGLYGTPGERTVTADQYRGILQAIREAYPNGLSADVSKIEFSKDFIPGVSGETKVSVQDPILLKKIQTAVRAKEGTWGREFAVMGLMNRGIENFAEKKIPTSNNPEILKETAPLTKEALEKISTKTAAGKFLHTIGDSKSIGGFLGKDANDPNSFCKKVRTSLKELDLNPVAGTEVTNWLDTSKKILVSVDDVKISTQEKEEIIRLLKRHPSKEMADNLVFFFEIGHTMVTNGADPQKNGPKMIGKNQYSGADQDLTTISNGDMIGIVDDMKKNPRLKKYAEDKTAYEFLAFYRNLVALYKEAK